MLGKIGPSLRHYLGVALAALQTVLFPFLALLLVLILAVLLLALTRA